MSWMPIGAAEWSARRSARGAVPATNISRQLRLGALALRTVFIVAVMILTVHVSLPQRANVWTILETPDDLMRAIVGVSVCVWGVMQLFTAPKDSHAYRTWFYIGLAGVPFVLICMVGIW